MSLNLLATLCMGASIALAQRVDDFAPRNIKIDGTKFVDSVTGDEVILQGSNVVMKVRRAPAFFVGFPC